MKSLWRRRPGPGRRRARVRRAARNRGARAPQHLGEGDLAPSVVFQIDRVAHAEGAVAGEERRETVGVPERARIVPQQPADHPGDEGAAGLPQLAAVMVALLQAVVPEGDLVQAGAAGGLVPVERRDAELGGRLLAGGEFEAEAVPDQVAVGEAARPLEADRRRAVLSAADEGQVVELRRDARADGSGLLGTLGIRARAEELREVHRLGLGAEGGQAVHRAVVGEELHRLGPDVVFATDRAVPEAVGGDREFGRDVGVARSHALRQPAALHPLDDPRQHVLVDEGRQIFVQDDPAAVPAQQPGGGDVVGSVLRLGRLHAVGAVAKAMLQHVVEADHQVLHRGDEGVLVVARIGDAPPGSAPGRRGWRACR
ncbi:MAG: hypothetical protein R6V44_16060 [Paracoccaceae bacterium]